MSVRRLLQSMKRFEPGWLRRWRHQRLNRRAEDQRQRQLQAHRNAPVIPRLVVFVSDIPRSREAKLAFGLQQSGWQVILLYKQPPTFDAQRYCTETHRYADASEALALCLRFHPQAYHVFSCWNFEIAAFLVEHRPGKLVFDDYDVIGGMLRPELLSRQYPGQVEKERFCLEQADGICCRGLEVQYLKREQGYRLARRRLFFADYCWNMLETDSPRSQSVSDVGLVYCGGISPQPSTAPGADGDFLSVARAFEEAQVHFHIFPAFPPPQYQFEEYYSEYVAFAANASFFHFHHPLPSNDLIRGMSGNVAGIHIAGMNIDQHPEHDSNLPARRQFAATNKLFDYLDADLPTIICNARLQRWMATRYSNGLPATPELLTHPQRFLDAAVQCAPGVEKARRAYAVVRQAPRLIDFYKSL